MRRAPTIAIIAAVAILTVALGVRYARQFKRVQAVEVGTTPLQLGTISRIVLTNNSTSKVEFLFRCYNNTHEEGRTFPSKTIALAPSETRDFDVYPELQPTNLPTAIGNRTCTAVWKGPFGYERRAWRAHWQYFRATAKVAL
jgi:hypothetical protein